MRTKRVEPHNVHATWRAPTTCRGRTHHIQMNRCSPQTKRVEPYNVHATWTYGGLPGKRARLRDLGLWAVDPPAYYESGDFVAVDLQLPEVGGWVGGRVGLPACLPACAFAASPCQSTFQCGASSPPISPKTPLVQPPGRADEAGRFNEWQVCMLPSLAPAAAAAAAPIAAAAAAGAAVAAALFCPCVAVGGSLLGHFPSSLL